jgi:hypothetical protein
MLLSGCSFILIIMCQWYVSDVELNARLSLSFLMALSLMTSFAVYTYIVLALRHLSARLVQTVTCILFSQSIVHAFVIPLFFGDTILSQVNVKNPFLLFISVIYLFISIGLTVWQFVISAHIYKYALNTSPIQSGLIAFGLMAVNILTISLWQ